MQLTETNHIHYPYSKIGQFRNVVKFVKDSNPDSILPTIEYTGRAKAHGTNAAIVFNRDGSFYCQSRSRVITPTDDNDGFAKWAYNNIDAITATISRQLIFHFSESDPFSFDSIAVYGEWCGQGIQSGTAINQLPRMFLVFQLSRIDQGCELEAAPRYKEKWNGQWLDAFCNSEIGLYNVTQFGEYKISIDFNNPDLSKPQLIQMTEEVEKECPIGKYFGVSGIGEGLVFTIEGALGSSDYHFKSKGEEHSKSKVKTIGAVDLEHLAKVNDMVEFLLNGDGRESRVLQAVKSLRSDGNSMDSPKEIPLLIQWLRSDIASENMGDIQSSGLSPNDVMRAVLDKAKRKYLELI
jgi:RNA ligase